MQIGFVGQLRKLFTHDEKIKLLILAVLSLTLAGSEVACLASLSFYVTLLSDTSAADSLPVLKKSLSIFDTEASVFWCGVLVATFYGAKFCLNVSTTLMSSSILRGTRVRLETELFKIYLGMPWKFHLSTNSSEVLRNVHGEVNKVVTNLIGPVICLGVSAIQGFAVLLMLLVTAEWLVLVPFTIVAIVVITFLSLTRRRLFDYGQKLVLEDKESFRHIREGVESMPETSIMGIQNYFVGRLSGSLAEISSAQRKTDIIKGITSPLIENAVVISIISATFILFLMEKSTAEVGASIAVIAAAAVRLKSVAVTISTGSNALRHYRPSLDLVMNELSREIPTRIAPSSEARFRWGQISFESVGFRHEGARSKSLRNVSLVLTSGERLGIIGGSGAGKSTVISLMMGLLEPTNGQICIDGKPLGQVSSAWQTSIGYVPQSVYAVDATLRENIALGVERRDVDESLLSRSIEMAQLTTDIKSMPKGLETEVGERGCRLSGGQRQRMGIARALYRQPTTLVLDEVTAGLDIHVEKQIVSLLENLPATMTIVAIAHRYSALSMCTRVIKFEGGDLAEQGSWDELCSGGHR